MGTNLLEFSATEPQSVNWLVIAGERLQADVFQQKLQNKPVDWVSFLTNISGETCQINFVTNFCGSFRKTWKEVQRIDDYTNRKLFLLPHSTKITSSLTFKLIGIVSLISDRITWI